MKKFVQYNSKQSAYCRQQDIFPQYVRAVSFAVMNFDRCDLADTIRKINVKARRSRYGIHPAPTRHDKLCNSLLRDPSGCERGCQFVLV